MCSSTASPRFRTVAAQPPRHRRRRCGECVSSNSTRRTGQRRGRRNPPASVRATSRHASILNGLELDTVDPAKKATKPTPLAGDEHIAEQPTLTWQAAKSATAHDVYFGTDRGSRRRRHAEVARIPRPPSQNPSSPATPSIPSATYYWRVDEVAGDDGNAGITKGDVWSFRVRQLAFPGAEGYGRFARGGRGGRVIEVTNLNDSGPGSLRAAVEAEGPRTVVFDVGGLITLESKLIIRNPYLTIAGQTAPGKGICIRNYNLGVGGSHDIIIRYVRVRPGNIAGVTLDGMGMAGTDHSIIDHCSISWTQDESFSSRGGEEHHVPAEPHLRGAQHRRPQEVREGQAARLRGQHRRRRRQLPPQSARPLRRPQLEPRRRARQGGRHTGRLDIRNNVVYNWGHRTTDGGVAELNFVNNYYKPGPASEVFHVLMPERHLVHAFGPQDYYVEGNVMEGHYGADEPLKGVRGQRNEPIEDFIVDKPFFESFVATQSAEEAYDDVLADVGCNRADARRARPARDRRNPRRHRDLQRQRQRPRRPARHARRRRRLGRLSRSATRRRLGHRPRRPAQRLGNRRTASIRIRPPATSPTRTPIADGDGFTNLEDYLNSLTARP